jgi:hypothetical protein
MRHFYRYIPSWRITQRYLRGRRRARKLVTSATLAYTYTQMGL